MRIMKFVDELVIEIVSGNGGNGMVAFRREKFVNLGGPSGGDGGKGGDVIFQAAQSINTLHEISFKRKYQAENGQNGRPKDQAGACGKDLVVKVPIGTLVYDESSGELLADLGKNEQRITMIEGGRGGKGNARFASSIHQTPRMAEKGEPGKSLKVKLELKLLADVGLVGLPNAGKSTFLRAVSNARPRVADYPFTTLIPSLGIVRPDNTSTFCLADIPGLIEGAHEGTGLGIQFLKHIERTSMLLHLVDLNRQDAKEAFDEYKVVRNELAKFSEKLVKKPYIVVANKIDITQSRQVFDEFSQLIKNDESTKVFKASGVTREGVDELLREVVATLRSTPVEEEFVPQQQEKIYRFLPEFEIIKIEEDYFEVKGAEIERLVAMTDFESAQAVGLFIKKLKKNGFIDELRKLQLADDNIVSIGEMEFEYQEFFN